MNKGPKTAQEFIDEAFAKADAAVKEQRNATNLFIWGGRFAEDNESDLPQLVQFLQAWQADSSLAFTWAMVEEVEHFYVRPTSLKEMIQDHDQIERVRLFGPEGDLSIRRDADMLYWHFISETHQQVPVGPIFNPVSFWDEATNQGRTFACHEQCYYQWRRDVRERRVTHKWASDVALTGKQYLRQAHYLENGRIAFVRYVDFKEAK
ncbi:MAG: hypothetical protein KF770_05265 [Anaerolineae bacterium]|nr:hypothetical protein [Anaerolineae bacterium]